MFAICDNINGTGEFSQQISEKEKDKYQRVSLVFGIYSKEKGSDKAKSILESNCRFEAIRIGGNVQKFLSSLLCKQKEI